MGDFEHCRLFFCVFNTIKLVLILLLFNPQVKAIIYCKILIFSCLQFPEEKQVKTFLHPGLLDGHISAIEVFLLGIRLFA